MINQIKLIIPLLFLDEMKYDHLLWKDAVIVMIVEVGLAEETGVEEGEVGEVAGEDKTKTMTG